MNILTEINRMVPMRDGVRLAADTHRSQGAASATVLMARTPYNEDNLIAGSMFDLFRAVQAGYVVVAQDMRVWFAPEGEFNPHFQETQGGVDAFAWAAAQPWSNGVLGTFGGSFCTWIKKHAN